MKIIIFFLLINMNCFSQDSLHRCPAGQKYWMGLCTSSLITQAGCYPDSIYEKISLGFEENMCGEGGLFVGDGNGEGWSISPKWNDRLKTCITKFYHYTKKKRIEITEKEFWKGAGFKSLDLTIQTDNK